LQCKIIFDIQANLTYIFFAMQNKLPVYSPDIFK
jgi:hypothetical protein